MALLGESFEPWVKKQIDLRQDILSGKKDNIDSSFTRDQELKYTLSKSPFIRLTSGVNIDSDASGIAKIQNLGLGDDATYLNQGLASKYILFSSRFNNEFTKDVKYGTLGPSYGFSSVPEYGLVPPPGILSIDVRALNKGSLREATIKIVCHNLVQFKIIDTLFLKLRYSLLLEWGHTMYFNNNGSLASPLSIPDISTDFLKGNFTQETLLNRIEKEKLNSSGNYDAFFGIIKNFDWQLLENGSYDITVKAISTGDVIESLKVNTNYPYPKKDEIGINPIYLKSTLHKILGDIKQKIDDGGPGAAGYLNGFKTSPTDNSLDTGTISSFTDFLYNYKRSGDNINVTSPNDDLTTNEGFRVWFANLEKIKGADGKEITALQYYIKLGTLLRIIESFLIYYDNTKTDGTDGNNPPVFKINHNYNTNFCLTTLTHLSVDPRVCIIPLSYNPEVNASLVGEYIKITNTFNIKWNPTEGKWKTIGSTSKPTEQFLNEGDLPEGYVLDKTILNGSGISTDELIYKKINPNEKVDGTFISPTGKTEIGKVDKPVELNATDASDLANLKNQIKSNLAPLSQEIIIGTEDPVGFYVNKQLENINKNYLELSGNTSRVVEIIRPNASGRDVTVKETITTNYKRTIDGSLKINTTKYVRNPDASNDVLDILKSQAENQKGGDILFRSTDDALKAKTMHIQVNVGYIIKTLDSNIDEDGNISVYDFLKELMSGIKGSLCNVNDFEVVYEESTNTFSIIDNALLASLYKNEDDARFNINLLKNNSIDSSISGFTKGNGSFITNFSLKTELFSRIANTIAIGAQANGNTTISNSTAFSEFNRALTDRVLTTKVNKNDPSGTGSIENKFKQLYNDYVQFRIKYVDNKENGINESDVSAAQRYVREIIQYELGEYTKSKRIPGVGFIPLNLQLIMDGLSGMKIYQTFDIDETLLPDEYKSRIRFIIRGVNHKVDKNGWETSVETLSLPKEKKIDYSVKLTIPKDVLKTSPRSLSPPDLTPITIDSSRNLYNEAIKYKDYVYEFSAKGRVEENEDLVTINRGTNKGKSFYAIDCSGFVNKVLGTSQVSSEDTTVRGTNFKQVSKLDISSLKEGDVIGIDNRDYDWDKGRFYGIDHILIVIKNPTNSQLEIWESNGPSVSDYNSEEKNSYGGVKSTPIDEKIKSLNERSRKIFVSSYLT